MFFISRKIVSHYFSQSMPHGRKVWKSYDEFISWAGFLFHCLSKSLCIPSLSRDVITKRDRRKYAMVAHTPDCPQIWENRPGRRREKMYFCETPYGSPHESAEQIGRYLFALLAIKCLSKKGFSPDRKGGKRKGNFYLKKFRVKKFPGNLETFLHSLAASLACVFSVISSLFLFELRVPYQHCLHHHNLLLDLVWSTFAFPALSAPTSVAFRPPWRGHPCWSSSWLAASSRGTSWSPRGCTDLSCEKNRIEK